MYALKSNEAHPGLPLNVAAVHSITARKHSAHSAKNAEFLFTVAADTIDVRDRWNVEVLYQLHLFKQTFYDIISGTSPVVEQAIRCYHCLCWIVALLQYCTFQIYSAIRLSSRKCIISSVSV